MTRTLTTARSHLVALLCLTLIIAACTPKQPATTEEWYEAITKPLEACLNGDTNACEKMKRLAEQYEKLPPCQYTPWPKAVDEKLSKIIPMTLNGGSAALDPIINEAKQNNYGDCRTRSSLATTLRFMKGLQFYFTKNFPASAQEFKTAMAELGPDNNLGEKLVYICLPLYPAALLKSGDTEQAKKVLQTPYYTPIKRLAGDKMEIIRSLLRPAEELFQIPNPQKYSFATLFLSGAIKDAASRPPLTPQLLVFLDALKTLAPYTPVPECILEYKE